jgi:hypothetical protein
LVLLVEDFAVLSGMQGALLQVMITEAYRDGEQVLCTMRSALAYTEGVAYVPETVRTRARSLWTIEDQGAAAIRSGSAVLTPTVGRNEATWTTDSLGFHWKVTLPANTFATLYIPTRERGEVREGASLARESRYLHFKGREKEYAVFEAAGGTYHFHTAGVHRVKTKRYLPTPVITPSDTTVEKGTVIQARITCRDEKATLRYTWDGQDPDTLFNAYLYTGPVTVTRSMVLKARAFRKGLHPSVTASVSYDFVDPAVNGIHWYLYRGLYRKVPDLSGKKPVAEGRTYHISLEGLPVPREKFVLRFEGFIRIPRAGEYTFFTSSNDGSNLYIDDHLVVNNDGEHGSRRLSGEIHLTPGPHRIRVEYFQSGGSRNLEVFYRSDIIPYQSVPGSVLYLKNPRLPLK